MWNPFSKGQRDEERLPGSAQPLLDTRSFAEKMRAQFDDTRFLARRHGATLPIAALPQLGRIEDLLIPLLEYLHDNPPSVDEEIAVEGIIGDYLPTTIKAYVGLNPDIALARRHDGSTPADDLMMQLVTLETAAADVTKAVYAHDADQLQTQGRFLRTKFQQSDLTI